MAAGDALSGHCRAQHRMPHRPGACTGCGCFCHAKKAPPGWADYARAIVRAARRGPA
jgi:hypothetical protein